MTERTAGNIILMTVICIVIFWIFMALRPAQAETARAVRPNDPIGECGELENSPPCPPGAMYERDRTPAVHVTQEAGYKCYDGVRVRIYTIKREKEVTEEIRITGLHHARTQRIAFDGGAPMLNGVRCKRDPSDTGND